MELLRLSRAARRLGVHPVTLRLWADSGKIPVTWVGRERRFSFDDTGAMKVPGAGDAERPRLEGLYVRGTRNTPPPGARGGTRRGLPQERPRHPAPTGTRPPASPRKHGITEDH